MSDQINLPVQTLDPTSKVELFAGHASHCIEPSALLMEPIWHGSHVFVLVS